MAGMRIIVEKFANISDNSVVGLRAPYLRYEWELRNYCSYIHSPENGMGKELFLCVWEPAGGREGNWTEM